MIASQAEEIINADRAGLIHAAMDRALQVIDDAAHAGDFETIDELLRSFDARSLSTTLAVGLLGFMKCMSDRLPSRVAFAESVAALLLEREPSRAERLLSRVAGARIES